MPDNVNYVPIKRPAELLWRKEGIEDQQKKRARRTLDKADRNLRFTKRHNGLDHSETKIARDIVFELESDAGMHQYSKTNNPQNPPECPQQESIYSAAKRARRQPF